MKRLSLVILVLLTGVLAFQSCKKDKKEDVTQSQVTEDDAKYSIETDKLSDDLVGIIDISAFDTTANRSPRNLPSCVTYTINGTGSHVEITLEFDANGCAMPNGNTYSGTVTIVRDFNMTTQTFTGSVAFDNFSVNGVQVEGSSTFERVRDNGNGHPQSTYDYDFSFTFPNGDVAQRNGHKVREWIQGFNTPRFNDNVFLVSGNAHILRRNGVELDILVTTPLRREATCHYFVSGVMTITKNGHTATLDFGNGTCDDEATLTLPNGQVRIIHL